MSSIKRQHNTVVSQAKKGVSGFADAYAKFIEKTTIDQSSKSLLINYSRSLAYAAIHFNRSPHLVSVEEINSYLYRMMVHEQCSLTYFKHAVFGLRYRFRLFGMEDKAIQVPPVKKEKKLPVVLSKQECKELFRAPRTLKHRFLSAFAYAGGLRMNELRMLKITDVMCSADNFLPSYSPSRKCIETNFSFSFCIYDFIVRRFKKMICYVNS